MRVWIDIDNPPQVQYLFPFRQAFANRGFQVLLTARDYGATYDLLRARGARFAAVGGEFGGGRWNKLSGVLGRAGSLARLMVRRRPQLVLSSSRSSAITARALGIPAFVMVDYEFVELTSYRYTGVTLLFPDVIEPAVFRRQGFAERRLMPFPGLKEDISFADVDLRGAGEDPFASAIDSESVRVLFRPPAESSHYYRGESGSLSAQLLAHLAPQRGTTVIFSPRHPSQVRQVEALSWATPPVILRQPVPFVPLLSSVDGVISAGGTMLREAAYLGVPAYSIFRGDIGGVDRHLERIGRLTMVSSGADFDKLKFVKRGALSPLAPQGEVVADIVAGLLERTTQRRG